MPSASNDSYSVLSSNTSMLVNQSGPSQNFTATGRPMDTSKPSGLGSTSSGMGFTPQAPQFLPVKFSDEDIIPVPVQTKPSAPISPPPNPSTNDLITEEKPYSHKFMSKVKSLLGPSAKHAHEPHLRVVYMPRGLYKKYFAKDDHGAYAGTEPQREWTDDELDAMFGAYGDLAMDGTKKKGARSEKGSSFSDRLMGGVAAVLEGGNPSV